MGKKEFIETVVKGFAMKTDCEITDVSYRTDGADEFVCLHYNGKPEMEIFITECTLSQIAVSVGMVVRG